MMCATMSVMLVVFGFHEPCFAIAGDCANRNDEFLSISFGKWSGTTNHAISLATQWPLYFKGHLLWGYFGWFDV